MEQSLDSIIQAILLSVKELIPTYIENPADEAISHGNVAICIINAEGQVFGGMYGTDRARLRHSYKIAWTKASQVWLTGIKTGEYERMVFNHEVEENGFGIEAPDLIGWEGGQPIELPNGSILSVGFSGFRGVSDLKIVQEALEGLDI